MLGPHEPAKAKAVRHSQPRRSRTLPNEPPFSGERPSKARERVRCNGMLDGLATFEAIANCENDTDGTDKT